MSIWSKTKGQALRRRRRKVAASVQCGGGLKEQGTLALRVAAEVEVHTLAQSVLCQTLIDSN